MKNAWLLAILGCSPTGSPDTDLAHQVREALIHHQPEKFEYLVCWDGVTEMEKKVSMSVLRQLSEFPVTSVDLVTQPPPGSSVPAGRKFNLAVMGYLKILNAKGGETFLPYGNLQGSCRIAALVRAP